MPVASIFLGRAVASPNPPCLAGHGHPQPVERAVHASPATVQKELYTLMFLTAMSDRFSLTPQG